MAAIGAQQAFSRGGARVSNAPIPVIPASATRPASGPRSSGHPGELYPSVGRPVERVVAFCNQRGKAEQYIKEGENGIKWTRLSCRPSPLAPLASSSTSLRKPRQLHANAGDAQDR
jgi:hypothetical protein